MAVPQTIALSRELPAHMTCRFIYYEWPDRKRGAWWRVDPGDVGTVLDKVYFFKRGPLTESYYSPQLKRELETFQPDVIVLGGFMIASNYLAFRWARRRGVRTVVFSETSRSETGNVRRAGLRSRIVRLLYRDLDLVIGSSPEAVAQLQDEFGFGDRAVEGRYAADIDSYFDHPDRQPSHSPRLLFANRLTPNYNPVLAVEVFADMYQKTGAGTLVMNADGPLRGECERRALELGVEANLEFLDNLSSWQDLSDVYRQADVMILPATFSVGNYTILEAMASGLGIIISDEIGGSGNLIEDGENGFRCKPSLEEFTRRLDLYLSDHQLFARHAKINREMVRPRSAAGTAEFMAKLLRDELDLPSGSFNNDT